MKRIWVIVDQTYSEGLNAYVHAFTSKRDAEQYRREENERARHNYGEPIEFVRKEKKS